MEYRLHIIALLAGSMAVSAFAASTALNPRDKADLVWVPAGSFTMGLSDNEVAALVKERPDWKVAWFAPETPAHTVSTGGYWIYRCEVTVAQFRAFCLATGRAMPQQPGWNADNHPVVNVTWNDAADYARWAGGRLPTEAEWEKAARGVDGRRFPWGNGWDQEKCNNFHDTRTAGGGADGNRTAPVGSYPEGASPFNVQDMAGNAWEWCADWYGADYYAATPSQNPHGPDQGELRVLRGGSWGSNSASVRVTFRNFEAPDLTYHDDGGFRCVVDPSGQCPEPAGIVTVKLGYNKEGIWTDDTIVRSTNEILNRPAIHIAKNLWKLSPAQQAGSITLNVTFSAGKEPQVTKG